MNFTDPSLYGSTLPQREVPFQPPIMGAQFAPWQVSNINHPWQGLTTPWQGAQKMVPQAFQLGIQPNAGFMPQEFGHLPQGIGYMPQAFAYPQQVLGYGARGFGYTPRNIGYTPQNYGYTPQNYGYTPQSYGYTPQSYGYTPQFYPTPVGVTAGNVGMVGNPWNVPFDAMPYNWVKTH